MKGEKPTGIIRLVLAFICGIFTAFYVDIDLLFLFILFISFLIFLFSYNLLINPKAQYSLRWMTGFGIQVSVFISSILICTLNSEKNFPDHFSRIDSSQCFVALVNESPVIKGKNLRFEVEILTVSREQKWKKVQGKCLVYIRLDSLKVKPVYGDIMLFSKKPQDVLPPMNPSTFDFQKWLANRQIFQQVFLKSSEFVVAANDQGNPMMKLAISWRSSLLASIRKSGIHGQEEAVLSALILGQDDEIDTELRQSYSTAGVMHILAVSGMHVGLIYAALCALIKFPGKNRKLKWYKAVTLILCLWFYAMLTGLSPSVLRAAMMLSFVVIGTCLERSSNPLNVLAASAMCLFLIFSPYLLFSAGFQLSFLAVGGILFLYKPLHSIFTPQTWLATQIWSIVSISLVAQVATFPLSIYYFHRFPNYFLLSNLLVIPIGTIVIFGGIIVLAFSWWAAASLFLGKILSFLIEFLNDCVFFLGNLPGASSDGIFLSMIATILLYVSIIFISIYFLSRRSGYLMFFLSTMIILLGFHVLHMHRSIQQSFWIVYHAPRKSYMQFFQGTNTISIVDSNMFVDPSLRKRISDNFLLEHAIKGDTVIGDFNDEPKIFNQKDFHYKFPFLEFNGEKIFLLNPRNLDQKPLHAELDYLLISGNPKLKLDNWIDDVKCAKIIADASNSKWNCKRWKEVCLKKGIEFINISESGAFLVNSK